MIDAFLKGMAETVFLALVVWREARGESRECRTAVAWSVMNRVTNPKWWGTDVLSVIRKKWQYSSMTDPKDPQLTTWPAEEDPSWWECLAIAQEVFEGKIPNPVPGADSYFDISIPAPNWTAAAKFIKQIGRVRFYDVDHDFERQAVA